jgi:hypothetical protein
MTQTIVQGTEDPLLVLDHQGASGNPSFLIQQDETAAAYIWWDQVNQVFNMGPASVDSPSLAIASDGTVSMGGATVNNLLVGDVLVNNGIVVNQNMKVANAIIDGLTVGDVMVINGIVVNNGNITNMTAGELVVQNGASVTGGLQVDNANIINMTAGVLAVQNGASVTGGLEVDNANITKTTAGLLVVQNGASVTGGLQVDNALISNMTAGGLVADAMQVDGLEVQQNALVGGNLTVTGEIFAVTGDIAAANFLIISSREIKDNIIDLSNQEALDVLEHLSQVKFNYKADDTKKAHIGFIAEDVPRSVASSDGKGISLTDIVSVLTRVVKEQQKTINALSEKCHSLELAMNRALS